MVTLIHGSDTAASRKFFYDEKQRHPDALLLEAEKINITSLMQIFEGGSLFGETKYVFIEQLITKLKKTSNFKDIVSFLEKSAETNDIYIWEGKDLEPSSLKLFKKVTVRPFKLPQTLFLLLDNIKPGNGKNLIPLFHQTIETAEVEMVFFMIIRQIRILLALSDPESRANIDEVKRIAPWQMGKLQQQASLFSTLELLSLYEKLYTIEVGQKTGGLSTSVTNAIDFLLLGV